MIHCDVQVRVAEHVRGTNAVDGSPQRIREAIEVADCCRQRNRFDLALELLDQVESFPIDDSMASQVKDQREKIARGDTSGEAEPKPQLELPPLLIRGWNFASAMARWISHGAPVCTREQIERRSAICQACPLLKNDYCTHPNCGCNCGMGTLISKLAVATEKCPMDKWGVETGKNSDSQ